jgi:hypothetical protein
VQKKAEKARKKKEKRKHSLLKKPKIQAEEATERMVVVAGEQAPVFEPEPSSCVTSSCVRRRGAYNGCDAVATEEHKEAQEQEHKTDRDGPRQARKRTDTLPALSSCHGVHREIRLTVV